MAAPPKHPSPHAQLGELFVRARRAGLDFEVFWQRAMREGEPLIMVNHRHPPPDCIRWPTDRADRLTWQAVLRATKEGWRRSFERAPRTNSEAALAYLSETLEALDFVAEERAEAELGDRGARAGTVAA